MTNFVDTPNDVIATPRRHHPSSRLQTIIITQMMSIGREGNQNNDGAAM